jgi:predicted secreted protein
MKWTSALAIYLLFWVMCAFFVLPFHGRRSDERPSDVPGVEPGAPSALPVGRILKQISITATISFAFYYLLYVEVIAPRTIL